MLLLDSTSAILRIVTATGADVDVQASYVDFDAPSTFTSAGQNTKVTTATTTTIVSSPTGTIIRNIKLVTIANIDSIAQTVTVEHTDGSTAVRLFGPVILNAGEWMVINEAGVLFVYNSDGSVKVQGTSTGLLVGQYIHTDSGNHTTGASTHSIKFILVGGGGGGAGVAGNNNNMAASGGGAAGGYTEHVAAVSPSTAYAYVAGAGGTAAANNAAGGTGGNSNIVIGANTWTAQGGAGGTNMANGATNLQTTVGTQTPANTANSPIVSIGGQAGGIGIRVNGMIGQSGDGGCSVLGAGGVGAHSNINSFGQVVGQSATNYGGGGAGGLGTNGNANGGAGGNGCVIIEEYT